MFVSTGPQGSNIIVSVAIIIIIGIWNLITDVSVKCVGIPAYCSPVFQREITFVNFLFVFPGS